MLIEVAAWREREAQTRDVPRSRVLKDDTIGDIAVQAPTTIGAARQCCARCRRASSARNGAKAISRRCKRGLARDPKTLPQHRAARSRRRTAARQSSCLKVLLRMTSERHGVAAKVIATVDDLDRIAADDEADVPALKGWRRELFGEKALRLKHGRLALAVERSRVVAVERQFSCRHEGCLGLQLGRCRSRHRAGPFRKDLEQSANGAGISPRRRSWRSSEGTSYFATGWRARHR